jgi:ribose 5-phosphate isomerase B
VSNFPKVSLVAPLRVGIAADHGDYLLKHHLLGRLHEAGHESIDFGDRRLESADDYPDFVVPMAQAVACGKVSAASPSAEVALGPRFAANKVAGVRECLIHESFSAHQGVEDDDLNVICLEDW